MEEEYITQYLKIALNLMRFEEGDDVGEDFFQNLSPYYWEAIKDDMFQMNILDGTKDGDFLDSKGKLKKQIIDLFIQLDKVREKKSERIYDWSQSCITALLSSL
jgi:hypothetical protein